MVESTSFFNCRCKIVGGKIVFCNVHAYAEMLLATCRYARDFLKTLSPAEEKDKNMLREIVMPTLSGRLPRRKKNRRAPIQRSGRRPRSVDVEQIVPLFIKPGLYTI